MINGTSIQPDLKSGVVLYTFSTPDPTSSYSMLLLPSEYHFPFLMALSPKPWFTVATVRLLDHWDSSLTSACSHCSVLQAILYATVSELQMLNLIISSPFLRSSGGFLSVLFVALQDLRDQDLSCACLWVPPLVHSWPRSSSHSFSHFGLTHRILCFWAFVQVASSAGNVLCLLLFLIST